MMPHEEEERQQMIVSFDNRHVFAEEVHIDRPPPPPPTDGPSSDHHPQKKCRPQRRYVTAYLFHLNKYMASASETRPLHSKEQRAAVRKEFSDLWYSLGPVELGALRTECFDSRREQLLDLAIDDTTTSPSATTTVLVVSSILFYSATR